MDQQTVPSAQRRNFLFVMVGAVGVALGGLISWPLWKYLAPGKKSGVLEKISVARGDVAIGKAHFFNFHGRPAVVLQVKPGAFAAFSASAFAAASATCFATRALIWFASSWTKWRISSPRSTEAFS